jgi:hypothetical protein
MFAVAHTPPRSSQAGMSLRNVDQHLHARAVLGSREDTFGRVERRIEGVLRRFEWRALSAGDVVAEHG